MIVPRGRLIGSGSFGKCYADGDVLVKVGRISKSEFVAQQVAFSIRIAPEPYSYRDNGGRDSTLTMAYATEYKRASAGRIRNWEQIWLVMAVVKYAKAGWLHNDLHDDNVLVCPGKQPLIIDFGMAYAISFDSDAIAECYSLLEDYAYSKLNAELMALARRYEDSLIDFANSVLLLTVTTKLIKASQRELLLDFWNS